MALSFIKHSALAVFLATCSLTAVAQQWEKVPSGTGPGWQKINCKDGTGWMLCKEEAEMECMFSNTIDWSFKGSYYVAVYQSPWRVLWYIDGFGLATNFTYIFSSPGVNGKMTGLELEYAGAKWKIGKIMSYNPNGTHYNSGVHYQICTNARLAVPDKWNEWRSRTYKYGSV